MVEMRKKSIFFSFSTVKTLLAATISNSKSAVVYKGPGVS
jgi:hypothetical protein